MIKTLLVRIGMWLARKGGLPEPAYDKALMGFAKAGVVCWIGAMPVNSDDIVREAYRTASTLAGVDSVELRFAVARELYLRRNG